MRFKLKFNRDGNYYFGLTLLVIASASIIWAFFFDGFDPEDFLVYFLVYAWGFTLLLKSDTEYRFDRLEKAVTALQSRLDQLTAGPLQENQDQQGETENEVDANVVDNVETVTEENAKGSDNAETVNGEDGKIADNTETVNALERESEANTEPETPVEIKEEE